jgi:hypothetical protein
MGSWLVRDGFADQITMASDNSRSSRCTWWCIRSTCTFSWSARQLGRGRREWQGRLRPFHRPRSWSVESCRVASSEDLGFVVRCPMLEIPRSWLAVTRHANPDATPASTGNPPHLSIVDFLPKQPTYGLHEICTHEQVVSHSQNQHVFVVCAEAAGGWYAVARMPVPRPKITVVKRRSRFVGFMETPIGVEVRNYEFWRCQCSGAH